jgi:isopentenyl-diphosphate delta-isomerase
VITNRKEQHLTIVSEQDVESLASTGLERYRLRHCALPEMSLAQVDLSSEFCGHALAAPLMITGMTGGSARAGIVNRRLAQAAQATGIALNLGSQRVALEQPELLSTYQVRDAAPDVLLLANLGAVQFNYGLTIDHCLEAVAAIDADGLVLHLNPLQEAVQPEGDTDFGGLLTRISELCHRAPFPVLVKEVGWGISAPLVQALQSAGVAAVDVSGSGGTSWSRVESYRLVDSKAVAIASAFEDWGIPTATALVEARAACPDLPLVASGGITTGVDAVKCLALGANLAGLARPLLRPALSSAEAVRRAVEVLLGQMRLAMFCTGCATLADLTADILYKEG